MSLKKVKQVAVAAVKTASGTAGEAFENSAYTGMVARYGKDAADKIIAVELANAGETLESFDTYRRFKGKIQNNQISFLRADAEASAAGKQVLRDEGFSPS
ncbi:hypothetical protein GTP45_02555 [Pseudoduganella sp. FT55W]|uniref:Uncharacterized protein n=1 Tax=Duganella rivi TaxID=2666083 RepID=A0A7X4GLK6_9BURK|nr:hypothetical protein [Duganella rivi]MYM65713.1 hypothetical protein [Duganella rivi]